MNILDMTPYVGLIISLITAAVLLKGIISSGEKRLEERVQKIETKLIGDDRRIQALENDMKHLPDRDMAHRLELGMEKVSGRLDTLDERLKPIDNLSRRLQEFLIEQAGKK